MSGALIDGFRRAAQVLAVGCVVFVHVQPISSYAGDLEDMTARCHKAMQLQRDDCDKFGLGNCYVQFLKNDIICDQSYNDTMLMKALTGRLNK
jgi:hypothetical protein